MLIYKATYDGQVFLPDVPLDIEPGTRVTLTVHVEEPDAVSGNASSQGGVPGKKSLLDIIDQYKFCGPPDLSERIDFYMGQGWSGYSDDPKNPPSG